MRVALLHPTYWPEVRRGSERLIHDLGISLVERGHEVTLLTTHRASGTETVEDGIRVVRLRRPPQVPERLRAEYFLADIPQTLARARRGGFDLLHSFSFSDGFAGVHARAFGGPPLVHSIHGISTRTSLGSRRARWRMLRSIGRRAAAVSVLSEAAAQPLRELTGIEPVVLPGGVRIEDFQSSVAKAADPILFCPASVGDPRKRVDLLIRAFRRLREKRPKARLIFTESRDPMLSRSAVEIPEGIEVVNADDTGRLAQLYAKAWLTVLPSVDEAFGLVLVESLAAGTPVVAARSGASPEVVTESEVGALFEPDDEGDLLRVLESGLDLATRPGSDAACRRAAARHDWERVVLRYEEVYRGALAV